MIVMVTSPHIDSSAELKLRMLCSIVPWYSPPPTSSMDLGLCTVMLDGNEFRTTRAMVEI
jgi:hypothetical protein